MLIEPEWMKVGLTPTSPPKVDRAQSTLNEVSLAEAGKFKDGRGHFNEKSIAKFAELASTGNGVKSRLAHPNASDDGVSKFLGRFRSFSVKDGKFLGSIRMDPSAEKSPHGNLADYVLTRAESDPESFGMSVVGKFDWFDSKGKQLSRSEMWEAQEEQPGETLWIPTELHAVDVVDTGNATSSMFSIEGLSWDEGARHATEILDTMFAGQDREVVEGRCRAFVDRYLGNRYGDSKMTVKEIKPPTEELEAKDDLIEEQATKTEPVDVESLKKSAREEAASEANSRAVEIAELCQLAGCPEKASELLRTDASIDLIRKKLIDESAAKHALSDQQQPSVEPAKDDSKKLAEAEYQAHKKVYDELGVTAEDLEEDFK
jgi:hypothetical protein